MNETTAMRSSTRTWTEEVAWLRAKGYRCWFNGLDALAAREARCTCCGSEQEYHGYSIAGIVNRSYAVCHSCGHSTEF